ncbi:MAG TPA: type II secretion system F family protein [Bacillota bacterium]|nr:type II secretion system F family protein [Bacillota bacterium]
MSWKLVGIAAGAGAVATMAALQVLLAARPRLRRLRDRLERRSGGVSAAGWLSLAAASALVPVPTREALNARLARAGQAGRMSVEAFLRHCLLSSLGGALLGLLAADLLPALGGPLLPGAMATLGWHAPLHRLKLKEQARARAVLRELAPVMDLMAACAEAGLGLSASIARVAERTAGPLGEELRQTAREIRSGRPVADALQAAARRLGVQQVSRMAGALIRADSLGVPVARVLREQASLARREQRQAFELALAGLPIKLTLCTVVFIFPVLFVLVILPNVLLFMGARW